MTRIFERILRSASVVAQGQRGITWLVMLLIALASMSIAPCDASAQSMDEEIAREMVEGAENMFEDMESAGVGVFENRSAVIKRRSLDRISRILDLDKSQLDSVQLMYQGYRADIRVYTSKLAEIMKQGTTLMNEVREGMQTGEIDQKTLQEKQRAFAKGMVETNKEFWDKSEALEKQFLSDIELLLTEAQLKKMDRVRMFRRRDKGSDQMLVSGSTVDLYDVLKGIDVDPDAHPDIREALLAWELDMDLPATKFYLVTREMQDLSMEMQEEIVDDPSSGFAMMQEISESMDEMKRFGVVLKEMNRTHVRLIGGLLDDAQREAFEKLFQAESFPMIYTTTNADRTYQAAIGFTDLDPDQKEQVQDAYERMCRDRDVEREKWSRSQETQELEMDMMTLSMSMMGMGNMYKEHREAVKKVEDAGIDRLVRVLNEDQRNRLPTLEDEKGQSFLRTFIDRAAADDVGKK